MSSWSASTDRAGTLIEHARTKKQFQTGLSSRFVAAGWGSLPCCRRAACCRAGVAHCSSGAHTAAVTVCARMAEHHGRIEFSLPEAEKDPSELEEERKKHQQRCETPAAAGRWVPHLGLCCSTCVAGQPAALPRFNSRKHKPLPPSSAGPAAHAPIPAGARAGRSGLARSTATPRAARSTASRRARSGWPARALPPA